MFWLVTTFIITNVLTSYQVHWAAVDEYFIAVGACVDDDAVREEGRVDKFAKRSPELPTKELTDET